jgi:hypothetical protein
VIDAAPPPAVVVTAEDGWRVRQDPKGWARLYPKVALAAGVGGVVRMECRGKRGAEQARCTWSETPSGYGFGQAAFRITRRLGVDSPPGSAVVTGRALKLTFEFRAGGTATP